MTMNKKRYHADTYQLDRLADRVLIPPDLVIGYSKCFGAEPTTTTVRATIASWKRLTDKVDTEQHIPRWAEMHA